MVWHNYHRVRQRLQSFKAFYTLCHNRLLKREIEGIEYYIADSDEEALKSSSCANKIETLSVFDDGITWLKSIQERFQEIIHSQI